MTDSNPTIRIFVSSPGDVVEERDRARQVIERMRRDYPKATLQAVLWEELPLPVTASFQETIDFLLERQPIDIAVFILWSRLGSPLGTSINRADGTAYRSGTEREFDLMLAAFAQSGRKRPIILAYVRKDDAALKQRFNETDTSEWEELIKQRQMAEAFIVEQFHDTEGRNLRAYQTYREPLGFVQRLRLHLRQAIDDLLQLDDAATWKEEPYRGLETFDVQHAPIFYGREEETCELLQRLRGKERDGCAFAVIVGASGSGKSSLARAGVAANLLQYASDDEATQWHAFTFIPTLASNGLCAGLVRSIAEHLPYWNGAAGTLADISESLAENAPLTIRLSIAPVFSKASEQAGRKVRLLIILDQLEELWTDRHTTSQDRERFLAAIEALAGCGHVTVLATLRSDFYHHAQQMPTFMRLKGERGHYDLLPPDTAAIHRLITEPARLSGLKFERNEKTGRSLNEVILEDASNDPNALPLLEYTLSELYAQREESRRMLTFAAYVELGGVEGAIGKRAGETFESLPADARAALEEILPLLVSVDEAGEQSAVRRRAKVADLTATPARKTLTEKLTAARFLTTDHQDETPIASLAHEALLRRWNRIVDWIAVNREQLGLRARVEQTQQRWEQQERDDSLLLAEGLPLAEGRELMEEAPHLLTDSTADYIRASLTYHQRRATQARRLRRSVAAVFLSLLVVITAGAIVTRRQRQREVTRSLVTAITTARGIAFPPTVDDLDQLPRQMVLEELVSRFESANGDEKLPLAFALARFGDVRMEFLVSQIGDARPDDFDNFVAAFQKSKQETLAAIGEAVGASDESPPAAIYLKARLAMLSLYLGDPSLAIDMCELNHDPIQRTVFIDECSSWCGDLIQLEELASQIDEGTFRSALCLVVGSMPLDRVTSEQRETWQTLLSNWHQSQPDSGTHSAAGWALRQWGMSVPAPTEPDGSRQWRVNCVGLTMLRIQSGKVSDDAGNPLVVTEDFFISDREITVGMFQQFIDDPGYPVVEKPPNCKGVDTDISPAADHPTQNVSWYDAVMFCNWLSLRNGHEPCYQRTSEKDIDGLGREYDAWRLDASAKGYRLPTAAEWEYACRAGTTTFFSFGDDAKWADAYGVFRADRTEVCATRLPNAWGLFDVHGNVYEWCNDIDDSDSWPGVCRGGSWSCTAMYCRSTSRHATSPSSYGTDLGFRVATFPSSELDSQMKAVRPTK